MAAGSSSHSKGRALSGALEIALDRKMQTVTNTMESIQNLSSWCLENRKHHSMVVHYWLKWLRRSGVPHRLNLFYLANDVIQNCKRKNAIVYRESFAEVLPEAVNLVNDPSILKSVERIFKIWEERGVYPEETIAAFKGVLNTGWGKRERSKSVRTKVTEKVVEVEAVNPKAVLKSKIVAEFRPQALIEELLAYKCSVDQIDLKEKQLSTMRVDVCSSETLKRLKDKAGGKKFSKDFEEASTKLEEFVAILDKQVKAGPAVTEALENAGVFYEAQYKEVKVVANAYTTFANRVSNLKKKLDQLKATLPDPEESPVPSPTMDAPSPTGSDSPFPGIGDEDSLSPMLEPKKDVPAKPAVDKYKETVPEKRDKPVLVCAEPFAVSPEPVAVRAEAAAVLADTVTNRTKPAAVSTESAAVCTEPSAVHVKPTPVHMQPAAVRAELATTHAKPEAAVHVEPATVHTEPATVHATSGVVQTSTSGANNHSKPAEVRSSNPATLQSVESAASSVHTTKPVSVHSTQPSTIHISKLDMDYCNEPAADNRNVEDMELSDVDEDSAEIIVEDGLKEKVVSESPPGRKSIFLNVVPATAVAAPPLPLSVRPETLPPPSPPSSPPPSPPPSPPDSPPASPTECMMTPPPPVPSPPTPPTSVPPPSTIPAPVTPGRAFSATMVSSSPSLPLPNLANVDLAKISSILSSLTSVMKHTGVSPASRPSPGTPTTPTASGLKNTVQASTPTPQIPLGNILSKVEITPEGIRSALSKTPAVAPSGLQGLAYFPNVPGNTALSSISTSQNTSSPTNTTVSSMKDISVPTNSQPIVQKSFRFSPSSSTSEVSSTSVSKTSMEHSPGLPNSSFKPSSNTVEFTSLPLPSAENAMSQASELSVAKNVSGSSSPTSLEMKIHNFLKGNPSFSGLNLNIPILGNLPPSNAASESQSNDFLPGPTSTSIDNVDGTPVRDERSGTPTQDEMMDKPTSSNIDTMSLLSKIMSPGSSTSSTKSPRQIRDEDYRELSNSLASYRSFSLGIESSPTAYRPSLDNLDLPSSLLGSPPEHFYPDTSFQEDEDFRDYEYSGPPPSVTLNVDKQPPKSILTSSTLLDSEEFQPIQTSYSHRSHEFGMQSVFSPSIRSMLDQGDSCTRLSASPELYGNYSLGGNEDGSNGTPTTSNKDPFFTPDSNHNNFPQSLLNSVLPQAQFPDSPHSIPPRQSFSTPNTHAATTCLPPVSSVESPLVSSISATSTIEFKNMLKNASRKTADDKPFVQSSKSSPNEGTNLLSQTGISPEEQQLQEEHYRIETRVSSSCLDLPDSTEDKGAPIQTLGYHTSNRLSGEPIQTVESIRVIGKGSRGPERDGGRVGWFEMSGTEGSFDNGQSSDLPPLGSNSGAVFNTQYKEHVSQFQDNLNNFRTNNFNPAFEPRMPPPIPSLFEKDLHTHREQAGPPGPPPGPSMDHGTLFPRDHPIPLMPPMDHPNLFSKETSTPHPVPHGAPPLPPDHSGCPFPVPPPMPPLPEHGGIPFPTPPPPPPPPVECGGLPFSPPPLLDRSGVPFHKDHAAVTHGAIKEHYTMNLGPPRDHMAVPQRDHNCPPRARENIGLPIHLREHHGPPLSSYPPPLLGPPRRDHAVQNRMMMRDPRQDFRPRDPFNSLKRPRPPFPRGPPFFQPKRPFYPPRY